MTLRVSILFALLALAAPAAAQGPAGAVPAHVLPFTEVRRLVSPINGVDYSLWVRLPLSYAEHPERHYPVVVTLDADYAFAIAANIANHLSTRGVTRDVILVSIAYTGVFPDRVGYNVNRTRDYTPTRISGPDQDPRYYANSGNAPTFLRVLEEEILPQVDRLYRTDSGDRTIVGHSYGALFGAWVLEERPALFRHYLLISPSLWYDSEYLLNREAGRAARPLAGATSVYLAVGDGENDVTGGTPMVDQLARFAAQLEARRDPLLTVTHRVFEGEVHASIFPTAFSSGLRVFYPATRQAQPAAAPR